MFNGNGVLKLPVNSLAPEFIGYYLELVIFELTSGKEIFSISCENDLRQMPHGSYGVCLPVLFIKVPLWHVCIKYLGDDITNITKFPMFSIAIWFLLFWYGIQ